MKKKADDKKRIVKTKTDNKAAPTRRKKSSDSRARPAPVSNKPTGKRKGTKQKAKPAGPVSGSKRKPTSPVPRARKPEPEPIADSRLLLPQKVCALVFNVSPQAIQQWPVKPREKRGREALYYLPDLSKFRDQQRDAESTQNLTVERGRLASAQADRTELEVAELRGELIPAHLILENWEPIAAAARAKVLGLPSKLKTAIPKLTDKDVIKIKTIVRGTLEDLANGGIPKSVRPGRRARL